MKSNVLLFVSFCSIISIAITSELGAEIYDHFESSEINPDLWYTDNNASGLLYQSGGFLSAASPPYSLSGCIDSKIILYGDFEVILPWSSSVVAEEGCWHHFSLNISDAFNPNYINEAFIYIHHDWYTPQPYVAIASCIVVDETYVDDDFISFSDLYSLSGSFKITRVGSTISVFYDIGSGWVLLTNAPNAFTCPVIFSIYALTGDIGWSYVKSDYISVEGTTVLAPVASTSPATEVTKNSAMLNGSVINDGGEACQYRFRYRVAKGSYIYTSWYGSVTSGQSFSETTSDLKHNKTYYFNAKARNSAGESDWGNEQSFVTHKAKEFMITFDDGPIPDSGPIPEHTHSILLQLMHCKVDGEPVKAAFFVLGDGDFSYCFRADREPKGSVLKNPELTQTIDDLGHFVGNHTQHHAWFSRYKEFKYDSMEDFVKDEISQCNTTIENTLGKTPPSIFRAPYLQQEDYPSAIYGVAEQLGFTVVGGKIADDWRPNVKRTQARARKIIEKWEEDEPVVLIFHDSRSVTHDHIYEIINYLQNEGYELVHFDPERIPKQTMRD